MRSFFAGISFLCFVLLATPLSADTVSPLRGDRGVLENYQPNGAVWLSEDRILVADKRFNNFQIFDTEGRRYLLFDSPSISAPAQYAGLTRLNDNTFLAVGSHYHERNHPRYRKQRSVLHRFRLVGEDLILSDFQDDFSPVESFRMLRIWGETPLRQMQMAGVGVDAERDLIWFGLRTPLSEQGELLLLNASLKEILTKKDRLEVTEVNTEFRLPVEERCGRETYLTDIEVLEDGSLLVLLTSDDLGAKRFCSSSIWRVRPGHAAERLLHDIAPGERATGMALRALGTGLYRVALVCDNEPEVTGMPAKLIVLDEPLRVDL